MEGLKTCYDVTGIVESLPNYHPDFCFTEFVVTVLFCDILIEFGFFENSHQTEVSQIVSDIGTGTLERRLVCRKGKNRYARVCHKHQSAPAEQLQMMAFACTTNKAGSQSRAAFLCTKVPASQVEWLEPKDVEDASLIQIDNLLEQVLHSQSCSSREPKPWCNCYQSGFNQVKMPKKPKQHGPSTGMSLSSVGQICRKKLGGSHLCAESLGVDTSILNHSIHTRLNCTDAYKWSCFCLCKRPSQQTLNPGVRGKKSKKCAAKMIPKAFTMRMCTWEARGSQ